MYFFHGKLITFYERCMIWTLHVDSPSSVAEGIKSCDLHLKSAHLECAQATAGAAELVGTDVRLLSIVRPKLRSIAEVH